MSGTGAFGLSSVDGYMVHLACPESDCYWVGGADAGVTLDELHALAAEHQASAHLWPVDVTAKGDAFRHHLLADGTIVQGERIVAAPPDA